MKPITLFIASFFSTAALALSDGIPVDRKTGKVTAPHTIVMLTAEQIEETQILGTFTLTSAQWREIRAKSPECPKRFDKVVPVTWNSCACGLEAGYVIALSRDRIAVLHDGDSRVSVESIRYWLFHDSRYTALRMNGRGEFHLDGKLIPFQTLLKALAAPPEGAKRQDGGYLQVELPMGAKPTDAVFESRLRQIAAAADQMGLHHGLFLHTDS